MQGKWKDHLFNPLDVNVRPYHLSATHLSHHLATVLRRLMNRCVYPANQIATGQSVRVRITGALQVLAHQEAGMMNQATVETMIQDMGGKILTKDEGTVHIIAVVLFQVVDQEGATVMVQAAMSATMMKNGMHTWQLYHHSTIFT